MLLQSNNQKIVNLPTGKVKQGLNKPSRTNKPTNNSIIHTNDVVKQTEDESEEENEFSDDEMTDFLNDNSENLSFLSASFKRFLFFLYIYIVSYFYI